MTHRMAVKSVRTAAWQTKLARSPSPELDDGAGPSGTAVDSAAAPPSAAAGPSQTLLLDLPAELLGLVLRFCSALGILRCTAVSRGVALIARQTAERLVEEMWALGTSRAARADGAAALHVLSHVAGRRPLIPGRFALCFHAYACDPWSRGDDVGVDLRALERIFLVFGDADTKFGGTSSGRVVLPVADDGLAEFVRACELFVDHKAGCLPRPLNCSHLTIDCVEMALRHMFPVVRPCVQTRKRMRRLEHTDDGDVPYEPRGDPDPNRPPRGTEPEEVPGFLIFDDSEAPDYYRGPASYWYPSLEAFFDNTSNYHPEDRDLAGDPWSCGCEGTMAYRCHGICNCLLASQLFHDRGPPHSIAVHRLERAELNGRHEDDRWAPDVEDRIDRALHALAQESEQELDVRAARGEEVGGLRRVKHCPEYKGNVEKLEDYEKWRREGLARPAEVLKEMGLTVKAAVCPYSKNCTLWD